MNAFTGPARLVWRLTGKPLYERLFGRYFGATIGRLNAALGELHVVRAELANARAELVELRAVQEELERQSRSIAAGHWDATALNRRLAAIEDRLSLPEQQA